MKHVISSRIEWNKEIAKSWNALWTKNVLCDFNKINGRSYFEKGTTSDDVIVAIIKVLLQIGGSLDTGDATVVDRYGLIN